MSFVDTTALTLGSIQLMCLPIHSRYPHYTRCRVNGNIVNAIYFPLGCPQYLIICSCGAMIIGHAAWKTHLSKCKRMSDFAKNINSSIVDETYNNTVYMDPIDLETYKKLSETPEFGKFENYLTVRYHQLDQWVCHCGARSITYDRIVAHHTKRKPECIEIISHGTYTTTKPTFITDIIEIDKKKKSQEKKEAKSIKDEAKLKKNSKPAEEEEEVADVDKEEVAADDVDKEEVEDDDDKEKAEEVIEKVTRPRRSNSEGRTIKARFSGIGERQVGAIRTRTSPRKRICIN